MRRAIVITLSTAACAFLAMLGTFAVTAFLHPDRGDRSFLSFLEAFRSPIARDMTAWWTSAAALVALPFALLLLIPTRLLQSIPIVAAGTLCGALLPVLVDPEFVLIAPITGVISGIAMMASCRFWLRLR